MAVLFKYRNPVSYSYAPGFVHAGIDGDVGENGESGNALYFIDFEPDNSYNIEMALQKIEGNYIIANDSLNKIVDRPYKVNDLLLSNNGNCYQIVKSSETSIFNNFKFDIVQLGSIKNTSYNNIKHIRMYDVSGLEFYSKRTGKLIKSYNPRQLSCWVNNRTEKPYSTNFYALKEKFNDDEDFAIYGAWIKMCAVTSLPNNENDINKIQYTFSIGLNCEKEYSLDGVFLNDIDKSDSASLGKSLNFKKNLEFPKITVFTDNEIDTGNSTNIKTLFNEVTKPGVKRRPLSIYTSYFSDYSFDSLHPFGNNISCTLSQDRTMWYKTGVGTEYPGEILINDELKHPHPSNESFYRYETIDKTLDPFGAGLAFTQYGVEISHENICKEDTNVSSTTFINTSKPIDANWFPKYSLGQSLSTLDESAVQQEIDEDNTHNLLLYSKYKNPSSSFKDVETFNTKSGNSLYFSGMQAKDVPASIYSYLTSPLNEFTCVIKNTETKEINFTEIPVMSNISFRNKAYYVSFEDDPTNDDENLYNTPEDTLDDDPTPTTSREDNELSNNLHIWSFAAPKDILYNNANGSSIDVYFLYNDTEIENANIDFCFSNSSNTYPLIKTLQQKIFFNLPNNPSKVSLGKLCDIDEALQNEILKELSDDCKEWLLNDSNTRVYKVTVTAKNDYYDTYVSVKLIAKYKHPGEDLYTEIVSEPLISWSNPDALPNPDKLEDYPISGIEEIEGKNKEYYTLTVKSVKETLWSGEIKEQNKTYSFETETSNMTKEFLANSHYSIKYTIENTNKYYFLGSKVIGTPTSNNVVTYNGELYYKSYDKIFQGDLLEDTVIGEDLDMILETYDVSLYAGKYVHYINGNAPIYIGAIDYGTNIGDISDETHESLTEITEEYFIRDGEISTDTIIESDPDTGDPIIKTLYNVTLVNDIDETTGAPIEIALDNSTFMFTPEEVTPVVEDTSVLVSGKPLPRETYEITINLQYFDDTESDTTTYKQYTPSCNVKLLSDRIGYVIASHYKEEDGVNYKVTEAELGGENVHSAISVISSNGSQISNDVSAPNYTFNTNSNVLTVYKPTKYEGFSVNAVMAWEGIQDSYNVMLISYMDSSTGEFVEQQIILPRNLKAAQETIYMDISCDDFEYTLLRVSFVGSNVIQLKPNDDPEISIMAHLGDETTYSMSVPTMVNPDTDNDYYDTGHLLQIGGMFGTSTGCNIELYGNEYTYENGEVYWYEIELRPEDNELEYDDSIYIYVNKEGAISTQFARLEIINKRH